MMGLPTRLSDEIEIWSIDNFLSSKDCDMLIYEANVVGFIGSKLQGKEGSIGSDTELENDTRTSRSAHMPDSAIVTDIKWRSKKLVESGGGIVGVVEPLQVQKYEVTNKYNPHYDTFSGIDGADQRNYTLMIYLNDEGLSGGCTYFPNIDLRIVPKKGMALLWNNIDSSFCREVKTLHMGESVASGTKYIVTAWMHKPEGSNYHCPDRASFFDVDTVTEPSIVGRSTVVGITIVSVAILLMIALAMYLYFTKLIPPPIFTGYVGQDHFEFE